MLYPTIGRSATLVQLHGGPEHAACGRNDAQLQTLSPAKGNELRDQLFVDRVRREDHAVEKVERLSRPLQILPRKLARLTDELDVNI